MQSMKLKSVAYWVSTALIAAAFVLGGAIDAAAQPPAVAFLAHLGCPAYFATLIGVWQVLGGLSVLVPRFPRLKEWAYAGIVFDLTGAAVSHAASVDGASRVVVPLALVAIGFASWRLRPESRKLGAAVPEATTNTHFAHTVKAAA
jgi:uncharacterized membrane protein YphA (DoxX/SURF4 family)